MIGIKIVAINNATDILNVFIIKIISVLKEKLISSGLVFIDNQRENQAKNKNISINKLYFFFIIKEFNIS
jgi:hypothetical protein